MDIICIQKLYEMYSSAYDDWKRAINNYRLTYEKQSGMELSEKLLIAFCKLRRIQHPLLSKEEYVKEMVGKHEQVKEES